MGLLERDESLNALDEAWESAAAGEGLAVFLGGEAGIGKTTLVEAFARGLRERRPPPRLLWGACDALFTPRPLGPLHDMAASGDSPRVATLLAADASRTAIFSAMLAELQARPTVAVFEDVHWADEATLDLLRFLGRRIARTHSLLIVTYRDDELAPRHPLRLLLGDLASSAASRRVTLRPLSVAAIQSLVGDRGLDAAVLQRQTGGNPFFVTEVLAGIGGLPPTVRDAILARANRLSPEARAVLKAAAVIGPRIEPELLARVGGRGEDAAGQSDRWPALEECLAGGMLLAQDDWLSFRHELARETILETVSPPHRMALHRHALDALRGRPAMNVNRPGASSPLVRLAHHAEGAGDAAAVLEFAPAAARESAAAGSHRAAATLYELALQYATGIPNDERAGLLEAFAIECNFVDRRGEGAAACREAIDIWRELGDAAREGTLHARLANMMVGVGNYAEARRHADRAIAILEAHPPSSGLSLAYQMRAWMHHFSDDQRAAIEWANKAAAVAESLQNTAEFISSRSIVGSALMHTDYEAGCRYMESNREAARAAGRETSVAHIYTNLGSASCELYQLSRAEAYLAEGIDYAADHDIDRFRLYMTAWQAVAFLRMGRYEDATAAAETVLAYPGVSVPSRITALAALGQARARRGDPDAAAPLDEALELIAGIDSIVRVGLVRAARAEAAWLDGDRERAAAEAAAGYPLALRSRHPWFTGELGRWLGRDERGKRVRPPNWTAAPYRAEAAGDWRRAAELWTQLRCPYEAARALANGDDAARIEAVQRFEALGARPAADELRAELRAAGVAGVPRGPRPATRENPYGLTPRQMEIVTLLAESLTNAQIAARLQLSPKTVDHHVSAVLAKMDARTREEAAELARRGGLLDVE